MALTVGIQPTRACVPEVLKSWSDRFEAVAAVTGVIEPEPADGLWRINIEHSYLGQLQSPFRLRGGGDCGFPFEKLMPGQRIFLLAYHAVPHHPNIVSTDGSSIWLLDSAGNITGDAQSAAPRSLATLADILAAIGLPDAAMAPPRTDQTVPGIILVLSAVLLVILRWGSRWGGVSQPT
jgi:hypothetical protein